MSIQIKNRSEQLIRFVKVALGILYVVMGVVIFLIREESALSVYPGLSKIAFAVLLISYGIFRLYRVYFAENNEEDEE